MDAVFPRIQRVFFKWAGWPPPFPPPGIVPSDYGGEVFPSPPFLLPVFYAAGCGFFGRKPCGPFFSFPAPAYRSKKAGSDESGCPLPPFSSRSG